MGIFKDCLCLQAALDVGGYNYSPHRYDVDHAKYPDRVMVGTESFPTSSFEMWDHIWNSSWVVGDFIWTSIDCKRTSNPPVACDVRSYLRDCLCLQTSERARSDPRRPARICKRLRASRGTGTSRSVVRKLALTDR